MAYGAPANGSLFLPRLLSIVAQGKVITALGRGKKGITLAGFCCLCTFLRIPARGQHPSSCWGKMGLGKNAS